MIKKHATGLVYVLSFLIVFSCQNNLSQSLDEEKTWRLSWRFIESAIDENWLVAEAQFDSLLKSTPKLDKFFLATGLEVKAELKKEEDILNILSAQDQEMLDNICDEPFLSGLTPCKNSLPETPENKTLQLELIKMYINDQYVRSNLMEDMLKKYDLKKAEVIIDSFGVETDRRNRERLKSIIDTYGFPTKALVGKDAMAGVFYIIQHADGDKSWQKSQLKHVEQAVKNGDMPGPDYAYLYDRIKVGEDKKQVYGTQFSKVDPINNILELAPMVDPKTVNERRREIGLPPIDMYKRMTLKSFQKFD